MMSIRERIERIFREVLGIEVPSTSTDIVAAGLLDSLALVTLLFEVEQWFDVTIPLEDLDIEGLSSVDRIATLVERLAIEYDPSRQVGGGSRP
jgi:acyl carrier protein